MKELGFEKMENLSGGRSLLSMFCNANTGAVIVSEIGVELGLVAAATGIGFWVIAGVTVGCLAYSMAN